MSARISTGLIAFLALASAASAYAQNEIDDWPEGSAMHTSFLMRDRLDSAEADLAQAQVKMRTLIAQSDDYFGERIALALDELSVQWIRYRGAECYLHGTLTRSGGTWPNTWALECEAQQTEQQATIVREAIECLQATPTDDRLNDPDSCLDPLLRLSAPDREVY